MRIGGLNALLVMLGLALACGRTDKRREVSTGGSTAGSGSDGCLLIGCSPGYVSQPDPDGPCSVCVLACDDVACTTADCQPGSHMEMRDDECCPVCVKDDALPCERAQQLYQEFRAQWLAQYDGQGCIQEPECTMMWEYNRCSATCGTPLGLDASSRIEAELSAFAEETCTSCPSPVATPCPSPPPLACFEGNCQYNLPAAQ
jgi:hypothetical protein